MSNKHTPGPWRVQVTGDSFVVEAHTHTEVISVDENGNPCRWSEYNEANGRLIAASPMLLEALEGIMRVEARDRVMPVGAEWDAARTKLLIELGLAPSNT